METTTKKQLAQALRPGDRTEDLICFSQRNWNRRTAAEDDAIVRCSFAELSDRAYNNDFGGVEGDCVIAFSEQWVYVKCAYDGSEWFQAVPRTPESAALLKEIPIYGSN